jgi:hypothetical protein
MQRQDLKIYEFKISSNSHDDLLSLTKEVIQVCINTGFSHAVILHSKFLKRKREFGVNSKNRIRLLLERNDPIFLSKSLFEACSWGGHYSVLFFTRNPQELIENFYSKDLISGSPSVSLCHFEMKENLMKENFSPGIRQFDLFKFLVGSTLFSNSAAIGISHDCEYLSLFCKQSFDLKFSLE